jgi:hypothetical protein
VHGFPKVPFVEYVGAPPTQRTFKIIKVLGFFYWSNLAPIPWVGHHLCLSFTPPPPEPSLAVAFAGRQGCVY